MNNLTLNKEERFSPFPLTPIQEAYWTGRSTYFKYGEVATHVYGEIEGKALDINRLNKSLQILIEQHDALRTIFLPDGQQQVLKEVPSYSIEHIKLGILNIGEEALLHIRTEMTQKAHPVDKWPLFEIKYASLEDGKARMFYYFDFLLLDGKSQALFFENWRKLYHNLNESTNTTHLTFKDYIEHIKDGQKEIQYKKAQQYWFDRVSSLPRAPSLPQIKEHNYSSKTKAVRKVKHISAEKCILLQERAAEHQVTLPVVFLMVYAWVLKTWCIQNSFVINLVAANRRMFPDSSIKEVLGNFTKSVLVACDFSTFHQNESFVDMAKKIRQQLVQDLKNSQVCGVEVVRNIIKNQENNPNVVMPIVFSSMLNRENTDSYSFNWIGETVYRVSKTSQVSLDLIIAKVNGQILIQWNFIEDLFPENVSNDMFATYGKIIDKLIDDPNCWLESPQNWYAELIPTKHQSLVKKYNQTTLQKHPQLLHQLFFQKAKQYPDKEAIITSELTISYQEVAERTNQLGHHLRAKEIKPNQLVAIVMEKGWEQVIAALGILASGAAYLPIDSKLPKDRIEYLLQDAAITIVITQSKISQQLDWLSGIDLVIIDSPNLLSLPTNPLKEVQQVDDLAYVIYTSGSTGHPKGVMIDHQGAVNTILDINQKFNVSSDDRVLALSSLSFDLSVYDIFGLLAAGGTIIISSASETQNPAHWATLLQTHKITIWNSVPALMSLLTDYIDGAGQNAYSNLRLVLLSGDWIPLPLPNQIKALNPQMDLISLGGATEASIWSIFYPIDTLQDSWVSIPYGRPLANQSFYVLNSDLDVCPQWVSGDLYIGGIGLAKGYWKEPQKTADHFMTHPKTGERLYKTGDLGRYIPDGEEVVIEFLGRADFQVKIQGFRVELGEIEAVLLQDSSVNKCVISTYGDKMKGQQLVAYVVGDAINQDQLRTYLGSKLPTYMVPSAFVILEQLPLTGNGKIDRKKLPVPKIEKLVSPSVQLTNDPTLQKISLLVNSILQVKKLESTTNLISLGATSIDVIRIANLFEKELDYRPSIDDLYKNSTVMGLYELYKKELLQRQQHQLEFGVSAQIHPSLSKLLEAPRLEILQQEAFKQAKHGLRKGLTAPSMQFSPLSSDEEELTRSSTRQFSLKPITLDQFGRLLASIGGKKLADKTKFRYGSCGGLYPVQLYIYVKAGRIENLEQGIYYYHSLEHTIHPINLQTTIDPIIYSRLVNRPIFEEAAFSIYLIAQLEAIVPIYREKSIHYATLEAGLMTQLLEMTAVENDLGLCQIGALDFYKVSQLFEIESSHVLIHSLVGGLIEQAITPEDLEVLQQTNSEIEAEELRLMNRISQLSDEEAANLLKKLSNNE